MLKHDFEKNIALVIIFLFLGVGITPIVSASYPINEQLKLNDSYQDALKNEDYETFKIQSFENGKIIDEYQIKIDKNKAIGLFERLETTSFIIKQIELLESTNLISKCSANQIKAKYIEINKDNDKNSIKNNNLNKRSDEEEFNFTDNFTFFSIVRKGSGLFWHFKLGLISFKLLGYIQYYMQKYPILGFIFLSIPNFLVLLYRFVTLMPSLFFGTLSPIWFNFFKLGFVAFIVSNSNQINVMTKNYNYTGVYDLEVLISGFTGFKINSRIFGSVLLGYAINIKGTGNILIT